MTTLLLVGLTVTLVVTATYVAVDLVQDPTARTEYSTQGAPQTPIFDDTSVQGIEV